MLKLSALMVAAAACMTAGFELDRRPWENDWQLGTTAALWETAHPATFAWAAAAAQSHLHEGVWEGFVANVLGWPPFALLGALAVLLWVLARLSAQSPVPSVGGLRNAVHGLGVLLVGAALLLIGAGAYSQTYGTYAVGDVWRLVHPDSFATVQMPALLDGLIEWPAWVPLLGLGVLLLLVRRRRALPLAPTFILHAPISAAPSEDRRVPADMKRTLEYLESLRGSRPSI
jgi:hypothetical protein